MLVWNMLGRVVPRVPEYLERGGALVKGEEKKKRSRQITRFARGPVTRSDMVSERRKRVEGFTLCRDMGMVPSLDMVSARCTRLWWVRTRYSPNSVPSSDM